MRAAGVPVPAVRRARSPDMARLTVTFTANDMARLRAEALLDGYTNVALWVRDRTLEAARDRMEERIMLRERGIDPLRSVLPRV